MPDAQTIPTMKGLPILGNLLTFSRDRTAFLMKAYRAHGDLVRAPVAGRTIWVGTSPDVVKALLLRRNESFTKFEALGRFSRPVVGDGILTAEGDKHKRNRRLIQPGFKRSRLGKYVETMARRAEGVRERWAVEGVDDLHTDMTYLTLAIASETMFSSPAEEYAVATGNAVHAATDYIATELGRPFHLPLSWPTPRHRRLRRAVGTLDDIVYGMIRERREQRRKADADGDASYEEPNDILSMLLNAQDEDDGSTLTDEQVRDEVMTLLVAGHETTANALTWAVYMLARHPEVAERLAEESRAVLGGRLPTFDDLSQMPYAMQVVKETLRLYPPAYMFGREALEDTTVGDWHVPKGTTFLISIFGIHRRADLFPDPERFDPDRFEGDREKELPRGAYVPFGDGHRICIGNHFALIECQVVLAHLGQHLRFESDGPLVPHVARVTLRPRDRIALRVTGRG